MSDDFTADIIFLALISTLSIYFAVRAIGRRQYSAILTGAWPIMFGLAVLIDSLQVQLVVSATVLAAVDLVWSRLRERKNVDVDPGAAA